MKDVLFVCTHNAGRSQIAQAFFEQHAPVDVRAESVGQSPVPDPAGRPLDEVRLIRDALELADRATRECLRADGCVELGVS